MKYIVLFTVLVVLISFVVAQKEEMLTDTEHNKNPFAMADYPPSLILEEDNVSINEDYYSLFEEVKDLEELVDMVDVMEEPNLTIQRDKSPKHVGQHDVNYSSNYSEQALTPDNIDRLRSYLRERLRSYEANKTRRVSSVPIKTKNESKDVKEKRDVRLGTLTKTKKRTVLPFRIKKLSKKEMEVVKKLLHYELASREEEISEEEKKGILFNIEDKVTQTKKVVELTRSFSQDNLSTKISVRIVPKKPLYNLSIYEHIPKSIAQDVRDITFYTANYLVIEHDPLIVWHFAELREPVVTSYKINKILSQDEVNTITSIPIAESVGIDITTFIPVLVIPVVGIVIVYFSKFKFISAKRKMLTPSEKKLVEYVQKAFSSGMTKQQIITQLKRVGWSDAVIKKVFRQFH